LQQIKLLGSEAKNTQEPYGDPRATSQFSKERIITATFEAGAFKTFEKRAGKENVNYNIL